MTTTVPRTNLDALIDVFEGARLTYTDEIALHEDMGRVLDAAGVPYEREVRLTPRDRIDFLVGGHLGIEVKVAGSLQAVTRQLLRYSHHDQVTGLLLVTTKYQHHGIPDELGGKPVALYSLLAQAF